MGVLAEDHLRSIAPYLLGYAVWDQLEERPPQSWTEMRERVDRAYQLSKEELVGSFRRLAPARGEGEDEFVLRVEEQRARLKQPEDRCMELFAARDERQKLSEGYLDRVDELARMKGVMGKGAEVTWQDLVGDARDRLNRGYKKAKAGQAIDGMDPHPRAPAPAGVPAMNSMATEVVSSRPPKKKIG